MTALAERVPDCNPFAYCYSTDAIRESASLMVEGLKLVQSEDATTYVLRDNHDLHLYIAPDLSKFLCAVLSHIEEGGEVTFAPNTKLFGLQEAADILQVPEQYLNQLIDEGKVTTKYVNDRPLVEARSLFSYKRKLDKEFDEGFKELINLTRDLY